MQPMKAVCATLLVGGLASLTCAAAPGHHTPSGSAESLSAPAPAATTAQEPKPAEPRPAEPAGPKNAPASPRQEPAAKPPRFEKQPPAPKQQEKAGKEQQKNEKKQVKAEQKEQKSAHGDHADNRNTARGGGRVPDKDFKAHFGQTHRFKVQRVITTTRIVPNQTRFAYSGYTFVFLQPWPGGWLLTDDCYIDYIDGGYFLLDPFHPGIQIGLSVVM